MGVWYEHPNKYPDFGGGQGPVTWSANHIYYDERSFGISPGVTYDTIFVTNEVITGTSGTLMNYPITTGSVVLSNGYNTYFDIGPVTSGSDLGTLVSSTSPYNGTINYETGEWSVGGWYGDAPIFAEYLASVTSPSLVNLNWDDALFPTILGVEIFTPTANVKYIAHERGTLKGVEVWTGIDEASDYIDLLQLVPHKFRKSLALRQLLYVYGLVVGTWVGEVDDLQTILDKWNVGNDYIQFLADLVGLNLIITPTTTFANKQQQLIQVIDWYKIKGTYQALKVIGYTLGLNLNLWDLYTNDYINFIQEPWFSGFIGQNPGGLNTTYYKSPHLGIEVDLNTIYGIAPFYYFFDGAPSYNNMITYIERVRPVNVVPQYSVFLNPVTDREGDVEGDKYTTTSTTSIEMPSQSECPINVTLTVGTGLPFTYGQNVAIVYGALGESHQTEMDGTVVSYNPASGQLVVTVTYVAGSGTYANWDIIGNIRTIALGEWIFGQVNYDSSYSTGTVSINNGSNSLSGVGTLWTQYIVAGDQIGFGTTNPSSVTVWYGVETINNNTSITLSNGYITDESISGTSGTLAHHPIIAGSLVLTNGEETYVDNGVGGLTSTISPSVDGTINYTTGVWSVTSWYGSGSEVASYQVSNYVGTNLSGSDYVSVTRYDSTPSVNYDISQLGFYESIVVWRLGVGNVGIIPSSDFSLQTPVLTNYGGSINAPISLNIQPTFVEFSFQLPSNITVNGLTELGLYLADGVTLKLGATFPSISLVPGISLRVVCHVNF